MAGAFHAVATTATTTKTKALAGRSLSFWFQELIIISRNILFVLLELWALLDCTIWSVVLDFVQV